MARGALQRYASRAKGLSGLQTRYDGHLWSLGRAIPLIPLARGSRRRPSETPHPRSLLPYLTLIGLIKGLCPGRKTALFRRKDFYVNWCGVVHRRAFALRLEKDFGAALSNDLRSQLFLSFHLLSRGARPCRLVRVNLRGGLTGDGGSEACFCADWSLRDVQGAICRLFGKSFPAAKASLVIDGKLYKSFMDKPFALCEPGADVQVIFSATNDPYFLRLATAPLS